MKTTHNDLPIVTCPHCQAGVHLDDYYNVKTGDTFDCPRCDRTMHVTCVDHLIIVDLSTEAEE